MAEEHVFLREMDDGIRASEGVVVCLADVGEGHSRLIFDDVIVLAHAPQRMWLHKSFFTWTPYENTALNEMALSDEQYRDIGIAVVARLLAINGRVG